MRPYLHVQSSIVSTSAADSHIPRDYHVEKGAQAWVPTLVQLQEVAPTDCLTGVDICDKNIVSFASLKHIQVYSYKSSIEIKYIVKSIKYELQV